MDFNKVLYISQEIVPYLPSNFMANFSRELSQGVQERGSEVRTFMPKYGCIKERRNQLHEVIRLSGLNIEIDDNDHPLIIKVATLQPARMQVYFIDNEDYFFRSQNSGELETQVHPEDNDERMIFYVRGVVETVKKLRWYPQLIHCSGWVSAMAPLYLRRIYADDSTLASAKIVYTLFNDKFEGTLDPRLKEKLLKEGFSADDIKSLGDNPASWIALNKLAIDYSDAITQASSEMDPELVEYVKASGKPFLPYVGEPASEGFVEKHIEFYNSL